MKNLLFFLLGFTLIIALLLNSAFAAYPGCQTKFVYIEGGCTDAAPCTTWYNVIDGVSYDVQAGTITNGATLPFVSNGYPTVGRRYGLYYLDAGVWQAKIYQTAIQSFKQGSSLPGDKVTAMDNATLTAKYGNSCMQNCPDSDNDGLCDACDEAPNDSKVGADVYLKGYYEYQGVVVASIISGSASNTSYDQIRFNNNRPISAFPGFVLGLNTPSSIDEKTFAQAGGKFVALATPDKIATKACAQVPQGQSCGSSVCSQTVVDASGNAKNPANATAQTPNTQQKMDDNNLLNTNRTRQERINDCANTCSSTGAVASFAESGGSYLCSCKSGGSVALYANKAAEGSLTGQPLDSLGNQLTSNAGASGTSSVTGHDVGLGTGTDTNADGKDDSYTGTGAHELDFKPLVTAAGSFGDKFPFSVIGNIGSMCSYLVASPQAPVFHPSIFGHTFDVDLSPFDSVVSFLRTLMELALTVAAFWGIMALLS